MMITKIMREKKQQAKLAAIVVFSIFMLILFVGSWRAQVRVANEHIEASWVNLSSSLERRQDFVAELIAYIQKQAPQEKKLLNALIKHYQSLPQAATDNKILLDAAANQAFVAQHLAMSVLASSVARYTWQKTTLSGDKQYYRKLKNLYVSTYQIKNTEAILNQDIGTYNQSLRGLSGLVLNSFFRYPKKLKLEDIVGTQMTIDEFMGEAPKQGA